MAKNRLFLFIIAIVLVFVFQSSSLSHRGTNVPATLPPTPYSALQPYTFIKVDSNPHEAWVDTDFHKGIVKPEALSATPFSYSTLPAVYRFNDDTPAFSSLSEPLVPFSGEVQSGPVASTAAPEPSTVALLAALCAFLAVSGYRRIAKPASKLE